MLFTIFISSFCSGDDFIHSTKFWSNMPKKDISANLNQKCLIFCSKILLDVLHNISLTVLFPDLPTTFGVSFWFCLWCLICMIRQAYKYVNLSSLPRLMLFELKIANISKSSGWGPGKSGLPWEHNCFFCSRRFVSCRTISLPSTYGLCCKYVICTMASFDYNYQNPSLFLFLLLIRAIVIQTHWHFKI